MIEVGTYLKNYYGEEVTVELWKPEDFAMHVREEVPQGAACGCIISEPDLDCLVFEAEQHDDELSMIPAWAEGERKAFIAAKLLGVSVLDSRLPDAFWLKDFPEDAPPELAKKLQRRG